MAGPFDAAMDFGPWHCVGKEDRVAFTHRDTGETRELKADQIGRASCRERV